MMIPKWRHINVFEGEQVQQGDIITTGTPPGVGMGMKPQLFLKSGDEMNLSIDNLGEQKSKVIAL